MRYTLDRESWLTPGLVSALKSASIEDTDQLLAVAGDPETREQLTSSLGLERSALDDALRFADLVRVKGIGRQTAAPLSRGPDGWTTTRIARTTPECLHRALQDAAKAPNGSLTYHGSVRTAAELIDEARELRTRLDLDGMGPAAFAEELAALRGTEASLRRRLNIATFGIVGVVLIALLLWFLTAPVSSIMRSARRDHPVAAALERIDRATTVESLLNVLSGISLVLLTVGVAVAAFSQWTKHLRTRLCLAFFSTPRQRRLYIDTSRRIRDQRQVKWLWTAFGVFAIAATLGSAGLVAYIGNHPELPPIAILVKFRMVLTVIGTLLVVTVFIPTIRAFRAHRNDGQYRYRKKFLEYQLAWLMSGLFILLTVTSVAIPLAFAADRRVAEQLVDHTDRKIDVEMKRLREMPLQTWSKAARAAEVSSFLQALDSAVKVRRTIRRNTALNLTPDGRPEEQELLHLLTVWIIWLMLLAFIAAYIAPLALEKPRYAAILIALFGVGVIADDTLKVWLSQAVGVGGDTARWPLLLLVGFAMKVVSDSVEQREEQAGDEANEISDSPRVSRAEVTP